jgi:hypothetical protein
MNTQKKYPQLALFPDMYHTSTIYPLLPLKKTRPSVWDDSGRANTVGGAVKLFIYLSPLIDGKQDVFFDSFVD